MLVCRCKPLWTPLKKKYHVKPRSNSNAWGITVARSIWKSKIALCETQKKRGRHFTLFFYSTSSAYPDNQSGMRANPSCLFRLDMSTCCVKKRNSRANAHNSISRRKNLARTFLGGHLMRCDSSSAHLKAPSFRLFVHAKEPPAASVGNKKLRLYCSPHARCEGARSHSQ
jgi:hypothetical protein